MKKTFSLSAVGLIALLASSCTKEGLGGDATLVATLKHHDHVIANQPNYPDTVFVKFNAKESAGENAADYDTYFVGEAGEDHVHVEGLKPGDYFLFGVGMDSSINQRVKGGVAVKIKHKEKDSEINVTVPVTEE